MKSQNICVLIIDQNTPQVRRLGNYLKESGFITRMEHEGANAGAMILELRPQFILIDLAMPFFSAIECLDFLQKHKLTDECRVIVLSGHNAKQNVESCLKRGARDFLVKPINPMDVLTRMILHLQNQKKLMQVEEIKNKELQQTNYFLHLVELLIQTTSVRTSTHQINYQMLRMLSMALNAVRISLVNVQASPHVIASSDDPGLSHLPLDLAKYPEFEYVLRTQKHLIIENLKDQPGLSFIKEKFKNVSFNTMIVLPILQEGEVCGLLAARFKDSTQLTDAEIRLCRVVAQLFTNYWNLQTSSNSQAS